MTATARSFRRLKYLVCVLAAVVVVSNGQTPSTPSQCYAADRCGGFAMSGAAPTVYECCVERAGLSFVVDGIKTCFQCVVYGFNTTQIIAVEREEQYGADIVLEKGGFDLRNARLTYDLQLVAGGTAMEGEDFTFEDIQIAFNSDTGPYPTVFFTFIPDGIAREGQESFTLELVRIIGTQQAWFFFTSQIELVILDGDIPSVNITLVEDDIVVRENEAREVCVVAIQKDFTRSILVQITYMDGTAVGNLDYVAAVGEVMISPESNFTGCFNLPVIDDDAFEDDEDFSFSISTTDDLVFINTGTAKVALQDDDSLVIGWDQAEYTGTEGEAGVVTACVALTVGAGGLEATLPPIIVSSSDGTALQDIDYVPITEDLTFTENSPGTMCVQVSLLDDSEFEPIVPEFFSLDLTFPVLDRVEISPQSARVNIIDDEEVTIEFQTENITVSESDGSFTTCLTKSRDTADTFIVTIIPIAGSAMNGTDFIPEAIPSVITLLPEDQEVCFTAVDAIVDDITALEPTVTFSLKIDQVEPFDMARVIIGLDSLKVSIVDDDVVVFGWESDDISVKEGSAEVEVCAAVLNGTLSMNIELQISLYELTATTGNDFGEQVKPDSLLFEPNGPSRLCTKAEIVDDEEIESFEPEGFHLQLTFFPSTPERAFIEPDTAQVLIIDNEVVTISFGSSVITVPEDNFEFTVCLVKNVTVEAIMVTLSITGVTAVDQIDYLSSEISLDLSLPPEDNTTCFTYAAIVDDSVSLEPDKSFILSIEEAFAIPDDPDRISLGIDKVEIVIIDDDDLVVWILNSTIETPENAGAIKICVGSTEFVGSIEIPISYNSITAQEGSDFTIINNTLLLNEGGQEVCFEVGIVDDAVYEDLVGEFIIFLLPLHTVVYSQQSVLVSILDDDNVYVEFSSDNYTALETQEFVTVCITRSAVFEQTSFTIDVFLSDVTAISGLDYVGGDFSVSFSFDTDPTQCFNVTILNDDEREAEKIFVVDFDLSSFPDSRIMLGARANVTVVIIDPSFSAIVEVNVNDTVSGDPVMTVPILVSEEQLADISADQLSLCYEVHGRNDEWFNLVSDECASVNAHYVGVSDNLNVIDEIAIRTTDSQSQCVNISVSNQNGCLAFVNGVETSRYSANGVSVRTYAGRVRISAPNCNELTLVMWVSCGELDFLVGEGSGIMVQTEKTIKFVVMRGLNYGHRLAHGLLGQFWNVPVSIKPYTGENIFGQTAENTYVLNITTISQRRLYVGVLGCLTWEAEEGPCLYVGDSQSDSTYEFEDPNDGVIEGVYTDYIVSGGFSDDFKFGLFDGEKCN